MDGWIDRLMDEKYTRELYLDYLFALDFVVKELRAKARKVQC